MYIAINKQTLSPYEFKWTEDDKLIINNQEVNPDDYEIIETDLSILN